MSSLQRILLATYLPITGCFLVLDWLYPEDVVVRSLKFTIMATLLFSVLFIQKNFLEQKTMSLALAFAVAGDFFLGFGSKIYFISTVATPLGMLTFCIAYLLLSYIFVKNQKFKKLDIVIALPVIAWFLFLVLSLAPFISGAMFYGAIFFGLALAFMSWNSVCTLSRGYYSKASSIKLALAGMLIFLSDTAVAHALFNPSFAGKFVPLIENIIWGSFIPAWTLIVLTISEPNLLRTTSQEHDTIQS